MKPGPPENRWDSCWDESGVPWTVAYVGCGVLGWYGYL